MAFTDPVVQILLQLPGATPGILKQLYGDLLLKQASDREQKLILKKFWTDLRLGGAPTGRPGSKPLTGITNRALGQQPREAHSWLGDDAAPGILSALFHEQH
ncbi:hypothetical protein PAPYR_5560 [Paratrimastix pyriformis]|uniref:Uncharacterized protein n=1 Tax=Paratrimastix pyriformis TaxID=342808 RepID=A0ABQ8UH96_9EUKA|nr:hypothetical protein PAPYR_5560 [Paratrimastix pyriformis]